VDGVSAFDTNDLLIRHPQNRKLWKVYGRQGQLRFVVSYRLALNSNERADDQIMHSNGEKVWRLRFRYLCRAESLARQD
jgi:hypothetical protein